METMNNVDVNVDVDTDNDLDAELTALLPENCYPYDRAFLFDLLKNIEPGIIKAEALAEAVLGPFSDTDEIDPEGNVKTVKADTHATRATALVSSARSLRLSKVTICHRGAGGGITLLGGKRGVGGGVNVSMTPEVLKLIQDRLTATAPAMPKKGTPVSYVAGQLCGDDPSKMNKFADIVRNALKSGKISGFALEGQKIVKIA